MDDIVAVKAIDKRKGEVAFLTWGRTFNVIDGEPLLEAIRPHLKSYGIGSRSKLRLCDTLQEVASYTYFFEAYSQLIAMFALAKDKKGFLASKRRAILRGQDVFFIQGEWHKRGKWASGFRVKS